MANLIPMKPAVVCMSLALLISAGCSRKTEQPPANTAAAPAPNNESEIVLTAAQAHAGAEASVNIPGRFKSVTVHIPPGVTDGVRLRLKDQALPGADGQPQDLVIRIRVR